MATIDSADQGMIISGEIPMNDDVQAANESTINDDTPIVDVSAPIVEVSTSNAVLNDEDEEVEDFESVAEDVSIHSVELNFESGPASDTFSYADELLRRRQVFDSVRHPDLPDNLTFRNAPSISTMDDRKSTFHPLNSVPDRPLSAFFRTPFPMSAAEIFQTLASDGFKPDHIKCLQRKPTGEVFITFKTKQICDRFLSTSSFLIRRNRREGRIIPNTTNEGLVFLTIYDAPYELSDDAIIHRLSPFCEVMWHRRGTYRTRGHQSVYNGLRHYRVKIHHAIPSYLRFGRFQIRLYHDGQTPTCRRCNRPNHKANECSLTVCFNCDRLGHEARECNAPMYCSLCKNSQHLARSCPFSWSEISTPPSPRDAADQSASLSDDPGDDQNDHLDGDDVPQDDLVHDAMSPASEDSDNPASPVLSTTSPTQDDSDSPASPVSQDDDFTQLSTGSVSQPLFSQEQSSHPSTFDDVSPPPPGPAPQRASKTSLLPVPVSSDHISQFSTQPSWADIVDRGSPVEPLPKDPKPRKTPVPRRRGATVSPTSVPPRRATNPGPVPSGAPQFNKDLRSDHRKQRRASPYSSPP